MLLRRIKPNGSDKTTTWLRWFVAIYVGLWGVFLLVLYVNWGEFALWQKVSFGLIEIVPTPDVFDLRFALRGKSDIYTTKL